MTLLAAAVCPHPPLLVPRVAGPAQPVAVLEPARAAVRRLVAARPDLVVVVGDAPRTGRYDDEAVGTLAGYGVDVTVGLPGTGGSDEIAGTGAGADASASTATGTGTGTAGSAERLPLSITIGAWLLAETTWDGPTHAWGVGADTTSAQAEAAGAGLVAAAAGSSVGLLVMGDGSARRTLKAPGYLDGRAGPHDQVVATALASVDPAALLALDPALSVVLAAAGRASWQVLAGAVLADRRSDDTHAQSWYGHLLYDDAPYGVGYLVAVWERGVRST